MQSHRAQSSTSDPSNTARDAAGLVLCGGASRRMGRDKALLELDGSTLLSRAVELLAPLVGEVALACGPARRYAELGLPLVLDEFEEGGPLAGLAAGLQRTDKEWTLAVACDMPRLDTGLLDALLRRAIEDDLDVCLPRGSHGLEPLCAVYRRSCRGPVQAALRAGERRMISFWSDPRFGVELRVGEIELGASAPGPDSGPHHGSAGVPEDAVRNLNSPQDYERELQARGECKP